MTTMTITRTIVMIMVTSRATLGLEEDPNTSSIGRHPLEEEVVSIREEEHLLEDQISIHKGDQITRVREHLLEGEVVSIREEEQVTRVRERLLKEEVVSIREEEQDQISIHKEDQITRVREHLLEDEAVSIREKEEHLLKEEQIISIGEQVVSIREEKHLLKEDSIREHLLEQKELLMKENQIFTTEEGFKDINNMTDPLPITEMTHSTFQAHIIDAYPCPPEHQPHHQPLLQPCAHLPTTSKLLGVQRKC